MRPAYTSERIGLVIAAGQAIPTTYLRLTVSHAGVVAVGLGRIVALHHRSPNPYQIH